MSEQNQNPCNHTPPNAPISRVIDFRVPLPWLAGVAFAGLAFAFNLDKNVSQITKEYALLQSNITALSAKFESLERSMNASTSDLALLRFRLENVEEAMRNLKDHPQLRTPAQDNHGGRK